MRKCFVCGEDILARHSSAVDERGERHMRCAAKPIDRESMAVVQRIIRDVRRVVASPAALAKARSGTTRDAA